MSKYFLIPSRLALLLIIGTALAQAQGGTTDISQTYPGLNAVEYCVKAGREAVLFKSEVKCADYGRGKRLLPKETPYHTPEDDVCRSVADHRRLPADTVRRLAETKDGVGALKPAGIRIFGGVFCDELDLVGLDLAHSVVLDRSFFRNGINARLFRTRGDLSIDQSVLFGNFQIYRGRIDGALFAIESFIESLNVLDADIRGTVYLGDSLLAGVTRFEGAKIGGALILRRSAISFLLTQFSQITGLLDLSQSEAQCAVHIRKNEIGELTAVNFGLGMLTRRSDAWGTPEVRYQWRRVDSQAEIREMLRRPNIAANVHWSSTCDYDTLRGEQVSKAELALFDNRVRGSACFRNFHRLAINHDSGQQSGSRAKNKVISAEPPSYLRLNYTTVGNLFVLNLASRAEDGQLPDRAKGSPRTDLLLEAVGLEARTLILNFSQDVLPQHAILDSLRFERVASADVDCPYQPPDERSTSRQRGAISAAGARSTGGEGLKPPAVKEVINLLRRNEAKTVQPYTAFIEAFDKAGQDAVALRVARADRDLAIQKEAWNSASPNYSYESAGKWLYFRIRDIWAFVADHGFQPIKALWIVAGLLLIAGIYFWGVIGVVGFEGEKGPKVRPIGLLFLFDRLIPLYNIRQEHYQITTFYSRYGWNVAMSKNERASFALRPPKRLNIFFDKGVNVTEATDRQTRWAGIWLDFMRLAGVLLAVFVVATVNALVTR